MMHEVMASFDPMTDGAPCTICQMPGPCECDLSDDDQLDTEDFDYEPVVVPPPEER